MPDGPGAFDIGHWSFDMRDWPRAHRGCFLLTFKMPASSADRLAVFVLVGLGFVGLGLWAGVLLRGRNGPLLTFLAGLNRLYLTVWFRWSSNGSAPLPDEGPAIVVANHTSPLDPMILQCGTDRLIVFMMAREYFEAPALRWFFRLVRSIPVNRTGRDTAATKAALRALDRGDVLGIFPEGRINTTGRGLLDPRPGVALIALRRQVPVIPAYVEGAPLGTTMVQPFFKRAKVRVTYGRPIDLSAYHEGEKNRQTLEEVSRVFMSGIARLGHRGSVASRRVCELASGGRQPAGPIDR